MILYPAYHEIANDVELKFARWKVFMHLVHAPVLNHVKPVRVKAWVLAKAIPMHRDKVNDALDWLVRRGYLLQHERDRRGVRTLTLAWTTEQPPAPDADAVERHHAQTRADHSARRARVASAPGEHTQQDVRRQYARQHGLCYYCMAPLGASYHVEHKTPLCRGGSNGPENICCACPSCNLRKATKTEAEFKASA